MFSSSLSLSKEHQSSAPVIVTMIAQLVICWLIDDMAMWLLGFMDTVVSSVWNS